MFWTTHPTLTIWEKEKNIPHWKSRIDLWLVLDWNRHNKHCLLAISLLPTKPDLRVAQLARLPWLVLWSVPTPDHALCTVPGLLLLEQTALIWSVAEPHCQWRHHLSSPLAPCQGLARSSWISLMKKWWPRASYMWHLSMVCRNLHHQGGTRRTVHQCQSLSLHLSLDFPDSGSPGDRHLGHQLHLRVNCSSKWSAKQCRKKEEKKKKSAAMIRRHAQIKSAWQDRHREAAITKSAMNGAGDSLKHFKSWKIAETNSCYIYLHQECLTEYWSDWRELFPCWSPAGQTVLPGQINWRAFAQRPTRLMKRPRGYLQGRTM